MIEFHWLPLPDTKEKSKNDFDDNLGQREEDWGGWRLTGTQQLDIQNQPQVFLNTHRKKTGRKEKKRKENIFIIFFYFIMRKMFPPQDPPFT